MRAGQPHGHELPWEGGRQRRAGRIGELQRQHAPALGHDPGHRQPAESRPGGRRAHGHQTRVARGHPRGLRLAHQGAQRGLPARRKRGNPQRPGQLVPRMPRQVQQPVDLGDGHRLRSGGHLHDLVTGPHRPLAQHPQVEPGSAVGDQQRRDPGVAHADAHPVAGDARLGHLELGRADPEPVTDAHLVVRQAVHREVLPELAVDEVVAAELGLPVPVRVDLVDEHGPVLPAVAGQVTLPVAVDVQSAHGHRAVDRLLPDRGADRAAAPFDVLRHADVDGEQPAYRAVHGPQCCRNLRSRHSEPFVLALASARRPAARFRAAKPWRRTSTCP